MTIAVMAAGSGEFGWSPKTSPTLPDLRCPQHPKATEAVSLSKYTSLVKSICKRLRLLGDPKVKFHILDVTCSSGVFFHKKRKEVWDQERRGNGWIRKLDMIVYSMFFILNRPISQKSRSVKAELLHPAHPNLLWHW